MKHFAYLFFLISGITLLNAQNNISYNIEKGIVEIEQQYVEAWKKVKTIEGFRIQIIAFAGINSKNSIETIAEQFKQQFPEIPFSITFFQPNYRLRVGNFCTKLEAYKALEKIAPLFPGAFVLKDQIEFKY
jgi:hypothetical protein